MNPFRIIAVGSLMLSVFCSIAGEDDYVTRAQFEKFVQDFEKFKQENATLKSQNSRLEDEIQTIKAEVRKSKPIEASMDSLVRASQEEVVRSGTTKLLISGWADAGFVNRKGAPSTFNSSFHPTFLWKLDERLSFESDFDYQTVQYRIDDRLEFEAGKFLTPLGAFYRDYRQSWINKLPDRPFVYSENAPLAPEFTDGAMFDGAFAAASTTFNWNVYVANGPSLIASDPQHFGELSFNNSIDNNFGKTFGGRLGWAPLPALQVGVSGLAGRVGSQGSPLRDVTASILAGDLSYVRDFNQVKGTFDFRSEWVWSHVSDAVYHVNGSDIVFENNNRNGGYAQVAYRPALVEQKWVRNLELVFRYDRIENPHFHAAFPMESAAEHFTFNRNSLGLNYWLAPSSVLKFAYETGNHEDQALSLQFAIGF